MHLDKAELQHKTNMAESALKARSEFLANMSHEIRTPIHGVQGMLEALLSSSLNSKQHELASIAMQSADALLGIVNDILDFSKIDSGNISFEEAPTNLAEVIEEQVPMFSRLAKEKGLELIISTTALNSKTFIADKLRIGQILINLLNNAIKFTKEGKITVDTKCTRYGKGRYRVKLIVTDSGIGISEQQQKIIFSPFMQAENSMQRRYGGTGLGLSIVKQLVGLMEGTIGVRSKEGQGSTFWFEIPCNLPSEEDLASLSSNAIDVAAEIEPMNILVVDDNELNRVIMKRLLGDKGHLIDTAVNGEDALNAMKVKRYELVLMDVNMPVMDGIEATLEIKKPSSGFASTPVVALTATTQKTILDKCEQAGMDGHVLKPIDKSALFKVLAKYGTAKPPSDKIPDPVKSSTQDDASQIKGGHERLTDLIDQLGPDYAISMVEKFLVAIDESFVKLKPAVQQEDYAVSFQVIHDLTGMAGNVGLDKTYRFLREMEEWSAGEYV